MPSRITRRDFLNGVALSIAAGLTPAAAAKAAAPYPPALTGLRGHHPGSFEVAHRFREGENFTIDGLAGEEHYDLVVVGAGLSGLAAAWLYRRAKPGARILILDNHDDFGGHAKRNEFRIGGRLILGYGGSESLQGPAGFSRATKALLRDIGVEVGRFETAFERRLYPGLGLSRGVFFPRESFGRDALVTGDPTTMVADDLGRLNKTRPIRAFVADVPVSDQSKADLVALYESRRDTLAGKSRAEKLKILKTTSYRDYLVKIVRVTEEAARCLQGRTLDYFAVGADAVPAYEAMETGYPGFQGLGLKSGHGEDSEPYIHHFPDGNASVARLLVRALIPEVAPRVARARRMDDVVLARFDYGRLDRAGTRVRIRLESTCVRVQNRGSRVELGYLRAGRLAKVTADHVVLACFNMVIPHIMPELPQPQREALALNVKQPLVYTKVLVRDWKAWAKLGVHEISAPDSFHCRLKLDYPVSLGGYRHPRRPEEPIGLHLVHVPHEPGLDARDQARVGRQKLLDMDFPTIETHIRADLDRMLGPGGFDSERDIAAITVNRWSHGYAYMPNSLFDGPDLPAKIRLARRPFGRVAIANSDAQWSAYAHSAIDAAHRAVREVLKKA
jgi:spermidine dehydrogenase